VDQAFEGHIQRISPVVDAATGTFRVTCEFRDDSRRLKSGMFGRLEVTYAQHDDVPTIPRTALIEEDGETAVFVVQSGAAAAEADTAKAKAAETATEKAAATDNNAEPGKDVPPVPAWVAKRRVVKVGYGDANYVEVLDGLAEGDRVITLGRSAVRDGTAVQLLEGVQ